MPQSVEINKEELIAAVNLLEEDGPLKSAHELHIAVANSLGITPAIVKNRIESWKIPIKTKKSSRKSYDIPETAENTLILQRPIYTPAGRCPIHLQSCEEDDVIAWAKELKIKGIQIGQRYLYEAIVYFAREFFDVNSREFLKIRTIIKQMFLEEASLQQIPQHVEGANG